MNGQLLDALREPANYGQSVGSVAESIGVDLGATQPDPTPVVTRPDPCPFAQNKADREIFMAVANGLVEIFNADRRHINNPEKWSPK